MPHHTVPPLLAAAVDEFTCGMRALDRDLLRRRVTRAGAQGRVDDACTSVLDSFRRHIQSAPGQEEALAAHVLGETFPFFALSRIFERSFRKPRGYAGDYLTIEMVYRDEAAGVHRLGPHIDRWFLDIPASRAVRNRRGLLSKFIADLASHNPALRVTSIASGPARELFDVLAAERLPDLRATCVDIDPEALAFSSHTAERLGVATQFDFVRANAVKVALGRRQLTLDHQDLVYSIGLIDYLTDDLVVALLDWIHTQLRPGGVAIVGNFDVGNPDRPFMDHLLDWRLIHRSRQDLRALFARSRFGDSTVDIRTEATGINLFAVASRV